MPWARVDDTMHAHPKVRKAWRCRPAVGLWALALSYVSQYQTDGYVPVEFVEDQLPDPGERSDATAALVDAGLWVPNGAGWHIHEFDQYNPSKADTEARRKADRERKKQDREADST